MNRSDKLIRDMQSVIKEAEVLLKHTDLPSSSDFQSAKERFESTLKNAKNEIVRIEHMLIDKTKEALHSTDTYVKEKPWQAVGLSAAVGVVLGLLIGRR